MKRVVSQSPAPFVRRAHSCRRVSPLGPAFVVNMFAFALLLLNSASLPQFAGAASHGTEPAIEFEDVTAAVGLAEHLENWQLAHGAAWGDVTGNDRPDLYIGAFADRPVYGEPGAPLPNMLLLQDEEGFRLSSDEAVRYDTRHQPRHRARVSMAMFADLTGNGKLDLLAGTHSGPETRLFENRWPESFRDVTPDPDPDGWPDYFDPEDRRQRGGFHMRNATAIDLDRDGLLDLIFIDGRYGGGQQRIVALRNLGDFRFEDVSEEYGFPPDRTRGLGAAIGDVNNNGRLDIFVAHSNRMFISQDDGNYVEYEPGFFSIDGLTGGGEMPCGAALADLTGNGLLDLVITLHAPARPSEPQLPGHVFLYVNRGIDEHGMPRFEHVSEQAGLDFVLPRTSKIDLSLRAAQFALVDLDNNGRRDILMGMVQRDEQGRDQPVVLRNTGVDDEGVPQFDTPPLDSILGYYATAPVTDYDRDGRIDIFLATWFHQLNSYLFRNVTDAGNYLIVRVRGEADDLNSMGVGAAVRLYASGHAGDPEHLLSRGDITLANGYSVGDEAMAHFGLGERESCDVVVSWQGREVTMSDVEANQYLSVVVGDE